jgi:membrane protein YdbS with pleckstrin-like domain
MADSLELILQVCPVPGDDAGALAELAGALRAELLDLDVQWIDRPGEALPAGAKGSADSAGSFIVQLHPKALPAVLDKVTDWATRSDRKVAINAVDPTLKLGRPARQEQGKVIGSVVPGTEVSPVRPEDETEAAIEVTPSVEPNRNSRAPEPGKVLVPLRPDESLPLIRERGELSNRDGLALALRGQESRRTAAFVGISSLLSVGLVILLLIAILAIAKTFHGFSISTSYPVHRVYQGIVRYFIRITPPPGSSHMLLVYAVYLAVLPVIFVVVFMHLKVGSTRLIVATVACVMFMVAPFVIAITSIRVGSTNCGSWNYPELNSGSECYKALTSAFRIAFAVGVVGLAVPIIYLIRGRQDGHNNGLLGALIVGVGAVMSAFSFIRDRARGQARDDRDVATDQKGVADVDRYLLPHEQQVISVRQHPAVLIGPSVLALDWLLVASVLTATVLHGNGPLVTVVWIVWLVLFARVIWKAIDWALTYFVITSNRFLLTSGVLFRKVAMLPLVKVTDMTFHRSFLGRLLGFGEFILESAGQDQALRSIDHLPYPEQLYLEVCALIFPGRDTSGD